MRRFLILLTMLVLSGSALAEHFLGGELRYEFQFKSDNSYTYKVYLTVYRDCSSFMPFDDTAWLNIINADYYRREPLSNKTISGVPGIGPAYCVINEPQGCFEKAVYTGEITVPFSIAGYKMYYSACCRDRASTNIVTDGLTFGTEDQNGVIVPGQGFAIVSQLPPHSIAEFNSSPMQSGDSLVSTCEDMPFRYAFQFTDPDGDSLAYSLCNAYSKLVTTLPHFEFANYADGFSGANPIGGAPQVTIDPRTGVLAGTATMSGFYTIVVCVSEYRNGQVINTHRKEVQVTITDCEVKTPQDILNCESRLALFTNGNHSNNLFSWDFGVAEMTNDTSDRIFPAYTYPRDGIFSVRLAVHNPRLGCSDTVFSSVKIYGRLVADFTFNDPVCNGEKIFMQDASTTGAGTINEWRWETVNNRQVIGTTQDVSIQYPAPNSTTFPLSVKLTVSTDLGCEGSALKVVNIYPLPVANAGPDTIISFNQSYIMQGSGGNAYSWTPATGLSDPFIRNPVLTGNQDQVYILRVGNNRCEDHDTVFIRYFKGPDIYVPNAFSPNNDGLNDVFHVLPVSMQIRSFHIFNRWGQVVHSSADYSKGWDGRLNGKDQPAGVYVWVIRAADGNGSHVERKGTIQLIR